MLDWSTYQAAYQAASAEQKAMIDSSQISTAIADQSMLLNSEQRRDLVRGIFLVITKKLTVEQLLDVLQKNNPQLDVSTLNQLVAKVGASAGTPFTPVRAMEDDKTTAQDGQTYTSSQDAILGKIPKPPQA